MPLTPAEKQRRYRERRENNPEKNAESKRKDLDRYHANKRLVRDLTTREHRAIKKKWRSANARQKDRVRRNSNEDSEIQYFSESQIWDPLENESSCEQPESTREVSIETPRPSKKSKTVEEEVLTTLYPNILSSQSHTNKSKDLKDDFTVFGEYIACELRRVKEEHAQAVAKHHINNIIFDAQMGKYNRVQPKSQSIPHYTETASSAHNSTEDVNNVKSEVIDNYRNMIS